MTELLPYELPLWFSNQLLYSRFKNDVNSISKITDNAKLKNFISLDFKIQRTSGGARILSIMHPCVQNDFCDFYYKYQDLIIYYCGRSKKSLRFPIKTASSFFKKEMFGISNQTRGIEESEENYSSYISFFKYDKFTFLYKFFESYDYNKLEKRFKSLVQADVSKCFHNIYTHSISWAVKNKYIAKRDIKKGGFDQEFDRLMQKSNYSETNGILIGPEISRIFAEIIFQTIDRNIISNLDKKNRRIGIDYDYRRYIDDYFIYYNDPNIKTQVIDAINSELFLYKMHLNEAKTIISERPFITEISICKLEISQMLEKIYSERSYKTEEENKLVSVSNISTKSNKQITELKSIVKRHGVCYSSVCSYCMDIISRKIIKHISQHINKISDKDHEKRLTAWLLIDIDLVYFIHAMDPRIVLTDKLVRLLLEIMNLNKSISDESLELIIKKIFDSSVEAIRIFKTCSAVTYPVETMNIMLLLSKIKDKYKLEETFIFEYFNLTDENIDHGDTYYFLWCSLMTYIEDDPSYPGIKNKLMNGAKEFFKKNIHKFESTEYLLFWGDYLACPYINKVDKREVVRSATRLVKDNKIDEFINNLFPDNKGLIIDWKDSDWLNKNMQKKVFRYAYE